MTTTSLTDDRVRVDLEHIGEGWSGDYDPDDPKDQPLLRFDVYLNDEPLDDASYCTQLPDTLDDTTRGKALRYLMDQVKDPAESGHSIKKLCERLSWIDVSWIGEDTP